LRLGRKHEPTRVAKANYYNKRYIYLISASGYSRLIEFDLLLRQAAGIPTSRQDIGAQDMVFGAAAVNALS
jgi:hypothetical protein